MDISNLDTTHLQFMADNGIITKDDAAKWAKRMEDAKSYISKIKLGADNRYWVRLPNGKMIRKIDLKKVKQAVYDYFGEETKKKLSFVETYQLWLEAHEKRVSKGTSQRDQRFFKTYYTNAPFLDTEMGKLDYHQLEDWLHDQIITHKLDKKTYYNMQKIIKKTLEYAYEYEIINKNLWESIKISTINCTDSKYANPGDDEYTEDEDEDDIDDQKGPQFFNNAERAAVVIQCWADYQHDPTNIVPLMILLDFNTGVRNGELTAFKPKDIEESTLFVRRMEITYKGPDGKNIRKVVNRTKSKKGRRKIPLNDAAKEILDLVPKNGDYLFMNKGKRVTTCMTDKYLRKVCSKVGIEVRSMHKIRKTFISKLFEAGMHPKKIQHISGHDNMDTLYKCYCFNTEEDSSIMEKINNASTSQSVTAKI